MWFLALLLLIPVAWFGYRLIRRRRRRAISTRPLPDEWREILERNVPLYSRLPEALRQELHGHVQLFLHDKRFHGFDGLEIDDEMRLTVAGNACVLLLNRSNDHYSNFTSIYMYPSTFVAQHTTYDGVVQSIGRQARLGESWHRGPLVLAWDSVLHGTRDIKDGHNVVLHEFAHKLDDADGRVDGAPILEQRSQYTSWARVMRREYKQLQAQAGTPGTHRHGPLRRQRARGVLCRAGRDLLRKTPPAQEASPRALHRDAEMLPGRPGRVA